MSIYNNLEKWLVTNCRSTHQNGGLNRIFSSGCRSFSIGEKPIRPASDIDIVFRNEETDYTQHFQFFPGKPVNLVSQRHISHTPFLLHYLIIDGVPLKIIDFYQWQPSFTMYRIFLFMSGTDPIDILSSVDSGGKSASQSILSVSSDKTVSEEKSDRLVVSDGGNESDKITVISISEAGKRPETLSIKDVYKLFHDLVLSCRQNHIYNNVRLKGNQSDELLDDWWFSQSLIFPDGSVDIKSPDYNYYLPWLGYLADILQSTQIREAINANRESERTHTARTRFIHNRFTSGKSICQPVAEKNEPFARLYTIEPGKSINSDDYTFEELLYLACFTELVPGELITKKIQNWWDLHSHSLFRKKIVHQIVENSELIFIIILHAIKNKLPWANKIAELFAHNNNDGLFGLILFIINQVSVAQRNPGSIEIGSGITWSENNKGIIFQDGNGEIRYTRFNKKIISRFSYGNNLKFSCDREVEFKYSISENKVWILPAIGQSQALTGPPNQCIIKNKDTVVILPLFWERFDFTFNEIRFRVIFKKRRFQITASCKSNAAKFVFNEQEYNFSDTNRHILYFEPQIMECMTQYKITDSEYRSVLGYSPNHKSQGYVYGWAINRYGIFPENYIYSFSNKKHLVSTLNSGFFSDSFLYDKNLKEMTISFRHFKSLIKVNRLDDPLMIRLLGTNTESLARDIQIIFDEISKDAMVAILQWFYEELGFYPEFIETDRKQNLSAKKIYIHFVKKHGDFHVNKRAGLIEIGIANSYDNLDKIMEYIKGCIILV